jgi:ribulose-phosphate 3-epimerase
MAEIIPAILPKNYEDLKNKISLVRGIAPVVQVDICDGIFVKNITWPFLGKGDDESFLSNNFDEHFRRILNEEEGLPFWEDIDFELDLMVSSAVENFHTYTKLGPRRIIFHIEAKDIQRDLEEFKNFLEGIDTYVRDVVEIGVAIGPNTLVEQIFPIINNVDFVQCMGIDHEGVQGEKFDKKCLEQIKKLKQNFSDLIIAVDGGVNFDTTPSLLLAGASRLVIGSAIFNTDDIINTIEEFKKL